MIILQRVKLAQRCCVWWRLYNIQSIIHPSLSIHSSHLTITKYYIRSPCSQLSFSPFSRSSQLQHSPSTRLATLPTDSPESVSQPAHALEEVESTPAATAPTTQRTSNAAPRHPVMDLERVLVTSLPPAELLERLLSQTSALDQATSSAASTHKSAFVMLKR
jgi:hypothetical protein